MKNNIITLFAFLFFCAILSGQNRTKDNQDCQSYYDTTLCKEVYQTVEIFPAFDNSGIVNFVGSIIQGIREANIILSTEEFIRNDKVSISFVVNEDGRMENIRIARKNENDYSVIDKEVLKIITKMSNKKWTPGICNDKKVSTLVCIPIRFHPNSPVI